MKSLTASLPRRSAPPVLMPEGARVCLRRPGEQDWPAWAEVRGRNREALRFLEPVWPDDALTEAFFQRRVAQQHRDWQDDRGYAFLIWLKEAGRLAGGFNLNHVCRGATQSATLGYWLDRDMQGQGLMTEAAALALSHAFGPLRLHRLNAATLPDNIRSQALLKRLGFGEEGFAPRYIQINGQWRDHVLYGLTVEEWPSKDKSVKKQYRTPA